MRGGGAYLFASENNTALEVKNQKILVQIEELQAEFESEDSLKKRNQIQEKIDTLKKQYAENALLSKNQNPSNTHQKFSLIQKKQTGIFLAISAGAFGQRISLWSDYGTNYNTHDMHFSGGAFLKLGYQKMWSDYFGGRIYLSTGGIAGDFDGVAFSAGADVLAQIPLGKVALGVYGGIGGGFLYNLDGHYYTRRYSSLYYSSYAYFHPKIIGMANIPFGVALAFGHSRFELGGLAILGSLDDFGDSSNGFPSVRMTYKLTMIGATLGYQYTF